MEATTNKRYKIIEKLKTKSQNQMFRGFDLKDKRSYAKGWQRHPSYKYKC